MTISPSPIIFLFFRNKSNKKFIYKRKIIKLKAIKEDLSKWGMYQILNKKI